MQKSKRWKQLRVSQARERRRLTRVRRSKEVDASWADLSPELEARVAAPRFFALEREHHDPLCIFLADLRAAFNEAGKVVCISFRDTQRMVAGGTLLFYSELQRLRSLFPRALVRCIPSKDDVVNEVLQHLGIFSDLGYESSVVPKRGDVVSWRSASSAEIDGEKVGKLLLQYESLSNPIAGQLFRGAGEAMFNVRHAYLDRRNDGLPEDGEKKWWMFCRESDNSIFVAVCDLGIGIPRSLPIKYTDEAISALISKLGAAKGGRDAKMIHAALKIRRSSTKMAGRGRGLADCLKIIDAVGGAQLFIFSNRGLVKYENGTLRRHSFERSIKGTVVLWVIPLASSSGESHEH